MAPRGIQKAVNEKPDLILMDLRMPNMDGIQATSCLRESEITKRYADYHILLGLDTTSASRLCVEMWRA